MDFELQTMPWKPNRTNSAYFELFGALSNDTENSKFTNGELDACSKLIRTRSIAFDELLKGFI